MILSARLIKDGLFSKDTIVVKSDMIITYTLSSTDENRMTAKLVLQGTSSNSLERACKPCSERGFPDTGEPADTAMMCTIIECLSHPYRPMWSNKESGNSSAGLNRPER